MARTKIEWTEEVWNPIGGCTRISPGCENCYAETMAGRFSDPGQWGHELATRGRRPDGAIAYRWTGKLVERPYETLTTPLRWRRPREVFVNSTSDLFHERVSDETIDKVFAIMALCPQHKFQVLTKRGWRLREYFEDLPERIKRIAVAATEFSEQGSLTLPLPNVALGVSVESPDYLHRCDDLLHAPAATRFVSAEPLLAMTSFAKYLQGIDVQLPLPELEAPAPQCMLSAPEPVPNYQVREFRALDGIIVGGESGHGARPMHPDWVRLIRNECARFGRAFFFKQWGHWKTVYDRDMDDPDWRQCHTVECKTMAGQWLNLEGGTGFHGERVVRVVPTGKGAAGRKLDGETYDQLPWR
jgi:protein gp37